MKMQLAFAMAAGLACSVSNGQVIISEVVDGPMGGGNPKMVEITNVGSSAITLGSAANPAVLKLYSNGSATAATTLWDFIANNVTLQPGQSWTVIPLSNGGQAQWDLAFGPSNPPSATVGANPSTGPFFGNGDDVYALETATAVNSPTIDAYGTKGERPAVGATWNYQDSYARRKPNVCSPNATFTIGEWILGGSDGMELPNQNNASAANLTVWTNNTGYMMSPNFHQNVCSGRSNDCNGNGIEDYAEVTANPSRDVDHNGIPDSCDVINGFATDCTGDAVPDVGQIEAGTFADANANGIPDQCEGLLFDCNANFIEDATDISNGTSQDCNGNNVPDECELARGGLTDANNNNVPDACSPDNAFVAETAVNATVTATGVRSGPNGDAFFNIEGPEQVNTGNPPPAPGTNRSYGGLRFPIAAIAAKLDTVFGAGQWDVEKVYLVLTQSNAAFTAGGDVVAFHSNSDTVDFTNGATTAIFDNFAADFSDAASISQWTFTQIANGTVEEHLLFDASATGQPQGALNLAAEIETGTGALTLVLKNADSTPTVAATYAGFSNNSYGGPTLVVFGRPGTGPTCTWQVDGCYADYNNDGNGIDGDDVIAFFGDWDAGNECADVDGANGVDGDDVIAFFSAWDAGGVGFPGC